MKNQDAIQITVELPEEVAYQLAQFIKRQGYSDCFQVTEHHLSEEIREQRAYSMLGGLDAIKTALAREGIAPR